MDKDRLRRLDFSLLLIFRAVLKHRQITQAAEDVGLTQSAVSHALKRLTDIVGEPLFTRERYGVSPTEAAFRMAGPAETILAIADETLGVTEPFDPKKTERAFTIGIDEACVPLLSVPIYSAVSKAMPNSSVTFVRSPTDMTEALADRKIDVAVTTDAPGTPSLLAEAILSVDYVGVTPKRAKLAYKTSLKRMRKAPVVLHDAIAGALDAHIGAVGTRPAVGATASSASEAMELAANIGGYTLVPKPLADARAKQLRLQAFDLPFSLPSFQVFASYHKHLAHDAGMKTLFTAVCRAAQKISVHPLKSGKKAGR
ncbi:MAG: LysR family transcriptional regulator [Pseudomonadota bacterium]